MPHLPGLDTERIAAALLVFLALLPTTFVVTWAVDGRPGVLRLVRRMFRWHIGARWWLIVIAGLPTLTMALALLLGDRLTPVDVVPFAISQTRRESPLGTDRRRPAAPPPRTKRGGGHLLRLLLPDESRPLASDPVLLLGPNGGPLWTSRTC